MKKSQGQSSEIAWSECLSHQTCKMKSCAPPGMHSVCVIHHIRHYQSYNEGFGSIPMLSFLSHSSDIFFPNNKLSHPFFITQVFQHWSSLKVREAFLWPEGHYSLNLPDFQWKPGWGDSMSTSQPPSACPWAIHSALIGSCAAAQDSL